MTTGAEHLRRRLLASHIRRSAVATRAGVPAATLSRFVSGNTSPQPLTFRAIESALNAIEDEAIALRDPPEDREAA